MNKPGNNPSPVWIVTRGMQPIRGLLTEVTLNGGCLTVDQQTVVPERFALYSSFRTKRGRPCRVKWRRAELIGFEFIETKGEAGRRLINNY